MKPEALSRDIDPHTIRYVLELPINRPDVFVRTTLEKVADSGVDGTELWEAYRLWAHREPMSESSFLAALEKAGFRISYADDHAWFVDGWCWPGTAAKANSKPMLGDSERPAARTYTFTSETLDLDKLLDIALLCTDFNGIAGAIGWPAKKFAIYRASFPHVAKAIEQVWKANPDRFEKPEPNTSGMTPLAKTTLIASARRALCGARAKGCQKQIAACKARLDKLQGKG